MVSRHLLDTALIRPELECAIAFTEGNVPERIVKVDALCLGCITEILEGIELLSLDFYVLPLTAIAGVDYVQRTTGEERETSDYNKYNCYQYTPVDGQNYAPLYTSILEERFIYLIRDLNVRNLLSVDDRQLKFLEFLFCTTFFLRN